ncbi:MAG: hypothetical protein HZA58_07870 [Acidimicrobiia bacterium]|nr:hypothetical protein [Acidimicrobiia bacterium]
MTLILSEVVSLLGAATAWLAVAVALAVAAGYVVSRIRRGDPAPAWRAAVIAGLLGAGLSSRLGLPDPAGFEISGRPFPPLWVLAGATIGAGVLQWRRSRVSDRGEGSAASPAPGAGRP